MSGALVVCGTDTDIGKTVFAAGLAAALDAYYWKPVQAGTEGGTDSERAVVLGVPAAHVLPESYRLELPASPHLSAAREGIKISPHHLALPEARPLVVEAAGGLMVPLSLDPPHLYIDQIATWGLPTVLVARTRLGTINHSLLSVEAMRARGIAIAGIVFIGEDEPDSVEAIIRLSGVPPLGRLPYLDKLDVTSLAVAMAQGIDLAVLRNLLRAPQ